MYKRNHLQSVSPRFSYVNGLWLSLVERLVRDQEAVGLVYIPAFSIHTVVNLEPVVDFAVELEA